MRHYTTPRWKSCHETWFQLRLWIVRTEVAVAACKGCMRIEVVAGRVEADIEIAAWAENSRWIFDDFVGVSAGVVVVVVAVGGIDLGSD